MGNLITRGIISKQLDPCLCLSKCTPKSPLREHHPWQVTSWLSLGLGRGRCAIAHITDIDPINCGTWGIKKRNHFKEPCLFSQTLHALLSITNLSFHFPVSAPHFSRQLIATSTLHKINKHCCVSAADTEYWSCSSFF